MKFNFEPPVRKRFSKGDFVTRDTDPNVSSGATHWPNSIAANDTCEIRLLYAYGVDPCTCGNGEGTAPDDLQASDRKR